MRRLHLLKEDTLFYYVMCKITGQNINDKFQQFYIDNYVTVPELEVLQQILMDAHSTLPNWETRRLWAQNAYSCVCRRNPLPLTTSTPASLLFSQQEQTSTPAIPSIVPTVKSDKNSSQVIVIQPEEEGENHPTISTEELRQNLVTINLLQREENGDLCQYSMDFTLEQYQYLHFSALIINSLREEGNQDTIEINFLALLDVISQFYPGNPCLSRFGEVIHLAQGSMLDQQWNSLKENFKKAIISYEDTENINSPKPAIIPGSQDSLSGLRLEIEQKTSFFTPSVAIKDTGEVLILEEKKLRVCVSDSLLANIRPQSPGLSDKHILKLRIADGSPKRCLYTPVLLEFCTQSAETNPGMVSEMPVDFERITVKKSVNDNPHGRLSVMKSAYKPRPKSPNAFQFFANEAISGSSTPTHPFVDDDEDLEQASDQEQDDIQKAPQPSNSAPLDEVLQNSPGKEAEEVNQEKHSCCSCVIM